MSSEDKAVSRPEDTDVQEAPMEEKHSGRPAYRELRHCWFWKAGSASASRGVARFAASHRLKSCWKVPGVGYFLCSFAEREMPQADEFDESCKLSSNAQMSVSAEDSESDTDRSTDKQRSPRTDLLHVSSFSPSLLVPFRPLVSFLLLLILSLASLKVRGIRRGFEDPLSQGEHDFSSAYIVRMTASELTATTWLEHVSCLRPPAQFEELQPAYIPQILYGLENLYYLSSSDLPQSGED